MSQAEAKADGPIRRRYLSDRIMLLLLYAPVNPERGIAGRLEGGAVLLKMGPLARSLAMNSTKVFDQLLFLQHAGYLTSVDYNFKFGYVRVDVTPPQCQWAPRSETPS